LLEHVENGGTYTSRTYVKREGDKRDSIIDRDIDFFAIIIKFATLKSV